MLFDVKNQLFYRMWLEVWKGENRICGRRKYAANTAAYLPQSCRKYGRKPSVDRMACEPADLPKTITDMPVKNVLPQALLASFLRGAICTQMINPLPLF